MANIRIKDLSTTAATTASDDFFGVDGSANGTRKLSAYSPTFGGNLTVSGTGTSSISGVWKFAAPNNYGTATDVWIGGNGFGGAAINVPTGQVTLFAVNNAEQARINGSGNLLLGTTTDSGNGKLQLATHTTSAGGIGFGTDTSLFRTAAGKLAIDGIANDPYLYWRTSGTTHGFIFGSGANITLTSSNYTYFATNGGTTALTLDSSQRIICGGALRLNNAYTAGAPTATGYVTIQDSAGNTYKVLVGT